MKLLEDRIESAKEDLDEWLANKWTEDTVEAIHEIADSNCPVYTSEIMEVCANDSYLASRKVEAPGFDGELTPVNVAVAAIYDAICEALHEYSESLAVEI